MRFVGMPSWHRYCEKVRALGSCRAYRNYNSARCIARDWGEIDARKNAIGFKSAGKTATRPGAPTSGGASRPAEGRAKLSKFGYAYDEHQALRALTKVYAFMERIADKIDYKHRRIRWGLR
jgi:hypothetical protein